VISLFETTKKGPNDTDDASVTKEFQFRKFAIDQAFQKQGVGSKMLRRVMEEARKRGGKRLWCRFVTI
jgi:GNAT superfamily N-acetyltransferase